MPFENHQLAVILAEYHRAQDDGNHDKAVRLLKRFIEAARRL